MEHNVISALSQLPIQFVYTVIKLLQIGVKIGLATPVKIRPFYKIYK